MAHNLMTALVFALGAAGSFGILYNLLTAAGAGHEEPDLPRRRAFLAPFFLLIVSNVEGLFEVLYRRDDRLNVSIFAQKTGRTLPILPDNAQNRDLVAKYAENIAANRTKVIPVVHKINDLLDTGMKVPFWGANTLMDLMVKYGGLDPKRVQFLADDYMYGCITHLHGIEIHRSEEFVLFQPDVVVVLARFNADLLAEKARKFGVRNVIKFTDLML